jgi:hypothetical protein
MNPVSNPNNQFSHDAVKYVYQESDMRNVNQSMLTIKPFNTEKTKKDMKKAEKKKSKEKGKEDPSSGGMFGLF